MSGDKSKRNNKRGPESRYYDTLKGQLVGIRLMASQKAMRVKLLWVDRYSIGVQDTDRAELLVYKHNIASIQRVDAGTGHELIDNGEGAVG